MHAQAAAECLIHFARVRLCVCVYIYPLVVCCVLYAGSGGVDLRAHTRACSTHTHTRFMPERVGRRDQMAQHTHTPARSLAIALHRRLSSIIFIYLSLVWSCCGRVRRARARRPHRERTACIIPHRVSINKLFCIDILLATDKRRST